VTRQQVPNYELARDTARSNLLTNGGFEIWQRGNGPFTTTGAYAADRWQIYVPIGTISIVRDAANADTNGYCAAVTVTGGVSAGNSQTLYQYPGATADGTVLPGTTVSLSMRVKTSVANGCRISLLATGSTRSYSAYHTGGSTYQTLTVTGYLVPAGTGNPVLSVEVNFEAAGTYYVDRATLVVGSVAADYAPLHPADDLARCLRYYEIVGGNGGEIGLQGYGVAGTPIGQYVRFRAQKAVYPTFTKNGTWNATNCGQPALSYGHIGGLSFAVTTTATGNVNVNDGAANCSFTVEANP
jgi:hypothetical protein